MTPRLPPGDDIVGSAKIDQRWDFGGTTSHRRRLYSEYSRLRTAVADVFGDRPTVTTVGRIIRLPPPFEVVR
ncbi:IS1 family transposase [Escherichia coli]